MVASMLQQYPNFIDNSINTTTITTPMTLLALNDMTNP